MYSFPNPSRISYLIAITALTGAMAVGCSSKKDYKVKDVDTELNQQGNVGNNKVGINDKGEAVLQEEKEATVELQEILWSNADFERKLTTKQDDLKRCREDLADPRLKGNGKITEIPEVDQMKYPGQVREELGLTKKGELKIVKKEYLLDRLEREKRYNDTLKQLNKMVDKYTSSCDAEMKQARTSVGLPSERYRAQGHVDNSGRFIVTREAERNLDDAFRIRAKEGAAPSPAVDTVSKSN